MGLSEITKRHFADELQRLAAEKPFAKVGVAELCRACGATRQTFYYHFRDKYDLAAWIYLQDLNQAVGPDSVVDKASLARMLDTMWERRDFYRSALRDSSQNNLTSYMQDYGTNFLLEAIEREYAVEPTRQLGIAVRYHSYGMNSTILDWLEGDFEATAQELAELLGASIEHIVEDLSTPR